MIIIFYIDEQVVVFRGEQFFIQEIKLLQALC